MTTPAWWTLTVDVPQIDVLNQTFLTLGEQLMASLAGIQAEIANLAAKQAEGSAAITAQLTVIADEISQLDASTIAQEDLDAIAAQIRAIAATEETQTAQIQANSQQIAGMAPDESPPTP